MERWEDASAHKGAGDVTLDSDLDYDIAEHLEGFQVRHMQAHRADERLNDARFGNLSGHPAADGAEQGARDRLRRSKRGHALQKYVSC